MTHVLKWGVGIAMVLGAAASACSSTVDADTNTSWSTGKDEGSDSTSGGETPSVSESKSTLTQAWSVNLTEEGTQANPPSLRWIDDRFVVAWKASTEEGRFPRVRRADVTPDGHASITEAANETYHTLTLALAPDGAIVVSVGSGFNDQCVLETYDTSVTKVATTQFPCTSHAAVEPLGAGRWLISYGEELVGTASNQQNIVVGHFDPLASSPISGLTTIGTAEEGPETSLYLDGTEAVLVWNTHEQGAEFRRLHDVTPSGPSSVTAPLVTGVGTEGSHGFGSLAGRQLVFGQNGTTLWTADVTAPSGPVASKVVAPTGIKDRAVGVAAAEELGLIGVCYATGPGPAGGSRSSDGVAFVALNADGDIVHGPLVIEDGFPNIGGCQVAWSGTDFAVAYWRIALPESSSVRLAKIQVAPSE